MFLKNGFSNLTGYRGVLFGDEGCRESFKKHGSVSRNVPEFGVGEMLGQVPRNVGLLGTDTEDFEEISLRDVPGHVPPTWSP